MATAYGPFNFTAASQSGTGESWVNVDAALIGTDSYPDPVYARAGNILPGSAAKTLQVDSPNVASAPFIRVVGIKIEVRASVSYEFDLPHDSSCLSQLTINGSNAGSPKSNYFFTGDYMHGPDSGYTYYTLGGATDLWGMTQGDIKRKDLSELGVKLSVTNTGTVIAAYIVDHVRLTVYGEAVAEVSQVSIDIISHTPAAPTLHAMLSQVSMEVISSATDTIARNEHVRGRGVWHPSPVGSFIKVNPLGGL